MSEFKNCYTLLFICIGFEFLFLNAQCSASRDTKLYRDIKCPDILQADGSRLWFYARSRITAHWPGGWQVRLVYGVERPSTENKKAAPDGYTINKARFLLKYRFDNAGEIDIKGGSGVIDQNSVVRLVKQGITKTENYGLFNNLQFQVISPWPYKIAQVNIPEVLMGSFPGAELTTQEYREILKYAFLTSLSTGSTVWVFQQIAQDAAPLICPIPR